MGQRKSVLIRKESKQVWVFITDETTQSLGLGSKLVKVLQVCLYTLFGLWILQLLG